MKNYSEQRGVHTKTIFDASTGQFSHRILLHEFESVEKSDSTIAASAEVIDLKREEKFRDDITSSRKSLTAVKQTLKTRRTG